MGTSLLTTSISLPCPAMCRCNQVLGEPPWHGVAPQFVAICCAIKHACYCPARRLPLALCSLQCIDVLRRPPLLPQDCPLATISNQSGATACTKCECTRHQQQCAVAACLGCCHRSAAVASPLFFPAVLAEGPDGQFAWSDIPRQYTNEEPRTVCHDSW